MAGWTYQVVDPATGVAAPALPAHDVQQIEAALAAAHAAWLGWRERSLDERAAVLRRASALLRERADRYAGRMRAEMGKRLAEGRSEVEKCAWVCDYYAEHAASFLAPEDAPSDAHRSYVRYDPLGILLAIMPWNFPFWQVFRFAAPALMAGNGFVLKHAPSTPGCAEDIEALLVEAGAPPGLCVNLRLAEGDVERVVADRRVAGVTLTGSTRAGRAVASLAGRYLKKAVLELGGSDPFVVLADADVDAAARVGAQARLLNAGQSCIAAKRFIVVEAVAEPFVARLREHLAAAELAPLARRDLRDELHRQVQSSVAAGARLELGGRVPEGPGCAYPATLLTGVGPGMPAWDEELFGPVAALRVVGDERAAIAAANDTIYGLGASLWTRDRARAEALVPRFVAGAVFVNGLVKSDPRLPFGGVKDSGFGRELGRHGIREFTNARTVWLG